MILPNRFYVKLIENSKFHFQIVDRVVHVDPKFWIYLAKASGLKSKKRRHIMKRAKKIFIKTLEDSFEQRERDQI